MKIFKKLSIYIAILMIAALFALAGCAPDGGSSTDDNNENGGEIMNITVKVNTEEFSATLADNETAKAFYALLPLTLNMTELNGNEKYCYLPGSLPSKAQGVGSIAAGDLMLYGSSCVVLFYESFSTSYSYTRIGKLDNPSGLADALGGGSVQVVFEKA